ncbi:hypothetical protein V0U79_08545 [Hyphobacterium sp. HN65]|uniref:Uncharacterized protein n=1 Tax=Hyphobacterium lacteum TaxID=3116575 RepID=A0ABU7LR76_9PROT|nr:hypothetical protein [Hyphobacterium sp. HN65]MEE2526413.1 hypothetical protein [Hyphobacterium sp. HN65]
MLLEFNGISLDLSLIQGRGGAIPNAPGIYAEIHWPTMTIRIGESKNIRSRNLGHIRWADKHRAGTHNEKNEP